MISPTFSTALAPGAAEHASSTPPATDASKPFAEFLVEGTDGKPDQVIHPLEQMPLDAPSFYAAGMQALQAFEKLLRERLDAAGIAPEPPMSFVSDTAGQVRLTSPHPQAEQIAEILQQEKRLSHYFNKASGNLAAHRAGVEHARFSAVYADNPDLAVQMFSHLFDDRPPPSLTVQIFARSMESYFV